MHFQSPDKTDVKLGNCGDGPYIRLSRSPESPLSPSPNIKRFENYKFDRFILRMYATNLIMTLKMRKIKNTHF